MDDQEPITLTSSDVKFEVSGLEVTTPPELVVVEAYLPQCPCNKNIVVTVKLNGEIAPGPLKLKITGKIKN